jgi:hypothetical protein
MRAYKPQSTRKVSVTTPPAITLRQMYSSFFQFEGQTYPVATSPTSIFKSAVRALHPGPFNVTTEQLLEQEELDLVSRWYLICELDRLKRPMQLI